jgi:hypothetical protein
MFVKISFVPSRPPQSKALILSQNQGHNANFRISRSGAAQYGNAKMGTVSRISRLGAFLQNLNKSLTTLPQE